LSFISAAFSCFLAGNDVYYDERFDLKEDYDMLIQQVNRYRKVLRVNRWYYIKKGAEQAGGCAAYRNVDREIEQIEALQKKWGKRIVKVDNHIRTYQTDKARPFDINPKVILPVSGI